MLNFSFPLLADIIPYKGIIKGGPKIRVRLAKNLPYATISGQDLDREIFPTKDIKKYLGNKSVRFNCLSRFQKKDKKETRILLASLSSSSGLLDYDVKKFQGKIDILADTQGKGCDVVNETSMEQYLSTLLAKEMNASWPLEVLKAQAVAARSYALFKINSAQGQKNLGRNVFFDLESSEKDQVSGHMGDSTASTFEASNKTKGEILLDSNGKIGAIFYHAKCGGKTILPSEVWDNPVTSYKSVECPYCHKSGPSGWESHLALKRIKDFLKWYFIKQGKSNLSKNLDRFKILMAPDQNALNAIRLYIDSEVYLIGKPHFRKYFGRVDLPSNNFTVYPLSGGFVFIGEGLGHGVGLCQLGALELAKRGMDYKQILSYYFPFHKVAKVY